MNQHQKYRYNNAAQSKNVIVMRNQMKRVRAKISNKSVNAFLLTNYYIPCFIHLLKYISHKADCKRDTSNFPHYPVAKISAIERKSHC